MLFGSVELRRIGVSVQVKTKRLARRKESPAVATRCLLGC